MKTKSIIIAFALSIGLFTASCSNSSDENEGETIAPIEGKWSIVKVGTNVNGTETLSDPPQNVSGCDHDFINLKINNTLESGDYDSTVSPCALTTTSGTYSRAGSKLTLTRGGTSTTYDIVNLTVNELKIKNGTAVEVYIR
ncbi:lipocalin family protein [Flavobacterium aquicola]|uniref:Lipocalin-like protein n=1 Tax=Flavobacterium aquicola TaxID=1682742 RepID=A0A3E0DYI4_9FLAO|nr:lipocalin family protein [Flavobacterium aquicola]REG91147.1 lipocalin-like protein [Flavobacterium aquicola]